MLVRPTKVGLLAVMLGAFACGDRGAAPALSSATATVSASAAPVASNDEIKSVYPVGHPAHPLAETYCKAVHERVAERKKECCGPSASALNLKDECVRMLSYAIQSGSVAADGEAIGACARDVERATEGCAWVPAAAMELPASCRSVIRGKLAAGTNCRSSLECDDGLSCHGIAATNMGVCGPPRKEGSVCGLGIDPLVAMMIHDVDPRAHAECEGACLFRKCVARPTPSGDLPLADAPCAAEACARGLRCVDGVCKTPGVEGAACGGDRACLGYCEGGSCKRGCPKPFALPTQRPSAAASTKPGTPPVVPTAPPR